MAKQILVACGNGIATSTVVATKIRNYLSEQGIDAETTQTRLTEVPGKVANYDLLVTTGKVVLLTKSAFACGIAIAGAEDGNPVGNCFSLSKSASL